MPAGELAPGWEKISAHRRDGRDSLCRRGAWPGAGGRWAGTGQGCGGGARPGAGSGREGQGRAGSAAGEGRAMQASGERGAALGAVRGALRTPRPLPPSAFLRFSAAPRMSGADGADFRRTAFRRKTSGAPGAGGAPARSTAAGTGGERGRKHRDGCGMAAGWVRTGSRGLPAPGQDKQKVLLTATAGTGSRIPLCRAGPLLAGLGSGAHGVSLRSSCLRVLKLYFLFISLFVMLLPIRILQHVVLYL